MLILLGFDSSYFWELSCAEPFEDKDVELLDSSSLLWLVSLWELVSDLVPLSDIALASSVVLPWLSSPSSPSSSWKTSAGYRGFWLLVSRALPLGSHFKNADFLVSFWSPILLNPSIAWGLYYMENRLYYEADHVLLLQIGFRTLSLESYLTSPYRFAWDCFFAAIYFNLSSFTSYWVGWAMWYSLS